MSRPGIRLVCLDIDGTLTDGVLGPPIPGTVEAVRRNRYFRKRGELVTDLGPVAAFLTYASGREAENLGKPSTLLFDSVAEDAGVRRSEIVMVGDDAEFDVSASVALGMTGILVRTGKFRPEDAARFTLRPSAVLDSVAELPGWLGT